MSIGTHDEALETQEDRERAEKLVREAVAEMAERRKARGLSNVKQFATKELK